MDDKPRVIKRYSNRKLYDMTDSRYITLEKIAEFVRAGQEIQVIDNQSQEDLTAVILSQILFEQEKRKRGGFLPISTLQNILQSGEQVFHRRIARPVSSVRGEAEKVVGEWVGEAEKTIGRVVRKGTDIEGQLTLFKTSLAELLQRSMDDFGQMVDAQIKTATDSMNRFAASIKELDKLKERIEDLEKAVGNLKKGRKKRS